MKTFPHSEIQKRLLSFFAFSVQRDKDTDLDAVTQLTVAGKDSQAEQCREAVAAALHEDGPA